MFCPLLCLCQPTQGVSVVWEMYRDTMLDAGFEPDTPLFVATGLLSCEWRCCCVGSVVAG